jgi:hypothetical protein
MGVDGHPVRSEEDLAQIMARLSAGSQAQLFLTNAMGTTSEVISVTLGTASERGKRRWCDRGWLRSLCRTE